jgi:hypothetical protein
MLCPEYSERIARPPPPSLFARPLFARQRARAFFIDAGVESRVTTKAPSQPVIPTGAATGLHGAKPTKIASNITATRDYP